MFRSLIKGSAIVGMALSLGLVATSQPVSASQSASTVASKLTGYTNAKSAGPTKNYYYVNGAAKFGSFSGLKAGSVHFSQDSRYRSATARAVLTYGEYKASQGSRQGNPLDPYKWPVSNPILRIKYSFNGGTYKGYMWNRSHSIADSLLGAKSYTSRYNFTTGTRPQNVGANQNGGMRYAEEKVENYWATHAGTKATVKYETTPVYRGAEMIPRGSIVDIRSSDGALNTEVVVINSAEGVKISYYTGKVVAKSVSATPAKRKVTYPKKTTTVKRTPTRTRRTASYTRSGGWYTAGSGKVFVSNSNIYYTRVKNPGNYSLKSRSAAIAGGARRAIRGNQYAQP